LPTDSYAGGGHVGGLGKPLLAKRKLPARISDRWPLFSTIKNPFPSNAIGRVAVSALKNCTFAKIRRSPGNFRCRAYLDLITRAEPADLLLEQIFKRGVCSFMP
jgi:hypothetical protein